MVTGAEIFFALQQIFSSRAKKYFFLRSTKTIYLHTFLIFNAHTWKKFAGVQKKLWQKLPSGFSVFIYGPEEKGEDKKETRLPVAK